jgi:hypothetical protein
MLLQSAAEKDVLVCMLGAFDHMQKAEIRETGSVVLGNRVDNFPIAAHHQFVS